MRGYHAGELEAQRLAGVVAAAARLEGLPKAEMPATAREFLTARTFAVVASTDPEGRMWASPLAAPPGFLTTPDARTLVARARPAAGDPLADNLDRRPDVGVVVMDFAGRRRMRLNGRARWTPDGDLAVSAEQVYANCPKYIRRREPESVLPPDRAPLSRRSALTARDRELIARADTMFIATRHPDGAADASHRGGDPGFVELGRTRDGRTLLRIPDYAGNNMFNTIGNLLVEPRAGLLLPDFATGAALELTGVAELVVAPEGRSLVFEVGEALELPGALGHRWRSL
jgi:predicted pyridoxine 5'-phosphate oxidase superfamily flavin-nucleotide-binding protein